MPLPALLAGLEALFARAAAGGLAEIVASKGSQAIGSQLWSGLVESKVAPKLSKDSVRLWRGVQGSDIAGEFAPPAVGVPAVKNYVSSRAAAESAAGKGGHVFSMDVRKADLPSFSPSPLSGSGKTAVTQYSIPFSQHASAARPSFPNPFAGGGSGGRGGSFVSNLIFGNSGSSGGGFGGFTPGNSGGGPSGFGGFAGGNSGGQSDGFSGYPSGRQGVLDSARQFWSSAQQMAAWRPPSNPGPATTQPYMGGPSYPNINPSQLVSMMGQPQSQIGQTNATNATQQAYQQQYGQNARQLTQITQQLTKSFKDLLFHAAKFGILWGSGVGTYTFGKTLTYANRSVIESNVDQMSMYSATYSEIGIRRRLNEINLNRELAGATGDSARRLNREQMRGERILNDIHKELVPIRNAVLTGAQRFGNFGLEFSRYVVDGFAKILRGDFAGVGKVGAKAGDENAPRDLAGQAIDAAVIQQRRDIEAKRRKPIAPIR